MSKRRGLLDSGHSSDHQKHVHHRGGTPPIEFGPNEIVMSRFPDTVARMYNGDLDNLEVEGFRRFRHIRCPEASNREPCFCDRFACHVDTLVVAVDGACPHNGTERALKSACGVFFGHGNPDNMSFRVKGGWETRYGHTNQRAELRAAMVALDAVKPYCRAGGQWPCLPGLDDSSCPDGPCRVKHVVVKSDSAYLVDTLGAGKDGQPPHMVKWLANGFKTAKGERVKNLDLWLKIVAHMRLLMDIGTVVEFWHVPRSENTEADRLANLGLDSERYLDETDGKVYEL